MRRPYFNGNRAVFKCPKCGAIVFNRKNKSCPRCKVGLKFTREFVMPGDYFWSEKTGWITFEELSRM